jgi:hypothetical protein
MNAPPSSLRCLLKVLSFETTRASERNRHAAPARTRIEKAVQEREAIATPATVKVSAEI